MLTVWVERGGIEDGVAATAAVAGGGLEGGWVLVGLETLCGCFIVGRKDRTTQRKDAVVSSNCFSNKRGLFLNERS